MSLDGRAIANFILDFCDSKDRKITNLSLQKIVYFCHVWSLIERNRPLVSQKFEAWQYGPVLQYLYREFKISENQPIIHRARKIDQETGKRKIVQYDFDSETTDFLVRVVDFYSRLKPSDLVELSHAKGGPWEIVWNHKGMTNPGMWIENESIINYYSTIRYPFTAQ